LRIKSERDFWSGLMFVAVGVVFAIGATHYRMGPECAAQEPCAAGLHARWLQLSAQPGAGYFPFGLAILLAVVGAIVLFKSLTFESEGGDAIGAFAWRPLIVIVAAVAGFGALLEPFGLAATIPLLVVVASLAGDVPGWRAVLAQALVLTLVAWAFLIWGLKLPVPLAHWFAG
jgi:hypothetical protein